MLKKTMTCTDFDGNTYTEDYYFNLTQEEVLTLDMKYEKEGGIQKMIETLMEAKDTLRIAAFFKEVISTAYGQKSADGKYFRKSKEMSEDFTFTQAYSDLFIELTTVEGAATAFMTAIVPKVDRPSSVAPAN